MPDIDLYDFKNGPLMTHQNGPQMTQIYERR
jgi:hypothetical protein